MDPKTPYPEILLAPSRSSSSGALRLPSKAELPPLDEHIVTPETREEMVRGHLVHAMPAKPPHGDRHFGLDYVIGAHVRDGYVGSTDLLTRTSETSDFATDTCVRKQGDDPRTGARYLEELAFEVVNEQKPRDMIERAEDLTARGVRRIVAIFVKKSEVCEWSPQKGAWQRLDVDAWFSDPVLTTPLRVRALLDAAEAHNAVARALLANNNPVLTEATTQSRLKGIAEGLLQGIEVTCDVLGIALTAEHRTELGALDAAGLAGLLARLRMQRRWPT